MTFYNTINLKDERLECAIAACDNQEDRLLLFFQAYPGKHFARFQLEDRLGLLTASASRALTNLTDSGKIIKTQLMIEGPHGKPVHTWILAGDNQRQIKVDLCGGEMGILERPLRGQTAKGERITLSCSDFCPVGSKMKFELQVIAGVTKADLTEWLDYGKLRGLGQWRNGSYGRFDYNIKAMA